MTLRRDLVSDPAKRRGRPATRGRDILMAALWTAVQREIHVYGAPSVRQACERLFHKRADGLIKFIDDDTKQIVDVIKGAGGADTLRRRYQQAERCRGDAENYPVLHRQAARLASLPGTYDRRQKHAQQHRDWQASGCDPLADFPLH